MIDVNKVLFTPRSGEEIVEACFDHPPIYLYSDLCKRMKESGNPAKVLIDIFKKNLKNFILIQSPKDPHMGHWVSLSMDPNRGSIYFFSSYGGRPDEEKNIWLSPYGRILSGQDVNLLNDGMKELMLKGWEIHYNQYPYQRKGDKTATCGIWATAFLNSNMNPDEFFHYCITHNLDVIDFYKHYFI